jgi:hypothetical protein
MPHFSVATQLETNRLYDIWNIFTRQFLQLEKSTAEEAAEKGWIPASSRQTFPQGLKPKLILRHLRHD